MNPFLTDTWPGNGHWQSMVLVPDQHLSQPFRVGVRIWMRMQEIRGDLVQGLHIHPLGAPDEVVGIMGAVVDLFVEYFLRRVRGLFRVTEKSRQKSSFLPYHSSKRQSTDAGAAAGWAFGGTGR